MTKQPTGTAARRSRPTAWAASALLGLLIMGVGAWGAGPAQAPAPGARVEIRDYHFVPETLTIPAGSTVTWKNGDDEPHTVTSPARLFASPGLDENETFSFTFSMPGTYTYFCALHPHMTATVIVK